MWLSVSALNLFCAVLLGAFGAHGLKNIASEQQLAWWATATDYFFYHALGLLALSIIQRTTPFFPIKLSFISIQTGIILFCGSLYIMALGGVKSFGMITPLGGFFMMLGWLSLAFYALKYRKMN